VVEETTEQGEVRGEKGSRRWKQRYERSVVQEITVGYLIYLKRLRSNEMNNPLSFISQFYAKRQVRELGLFVYENSSQTSITLMLIKSQSRQQGKSVCMAPCGVDTRTLPSKFVLRGAYE
jgi:hypothetical protein